MDGWDVWISGAESCLKREEIHDARVGCLFGDPLLMDEILHHLGWLKPYK